MRRRKSERRPPLSRLTTIAPDKPHRKRRTSVAIALVMLIPLLAANQASAVGPDIDVSENDDRGKIQFRAKPTGNHDSEIELSVVFRQGVNRYARSVVETFTIRKGDYRTYTSGHKALSGHIAAIHVDVKQINRGVELDHFIIDGKVVDHSGNEGGGTTDLGRRADVRCYSKVAKGDTLANLLPYIPTESNVDLEPEDLWKLRSQTCSTFPNGSHKLAWEGRIYSFYKIPRSTVYSSHEVYKPFEQDFLPLLFQKASQGAYAGTIGRYTKAKLDGQPAVSIFHRSNDWNSRQRCIVAFRGSVDRKDWWNNTKSQFWSTEGLLPTEANFTYEMGRGARAFYTAHRGELISFKGFYDHLSPLYEPIHDRLKDLNCEYLGVTGHSLGGVSAQYFALWTMFDKSRGPEYKLTDVVTFNTPRGTSLAGARIIPDFVASHGRNRSSFIRWETYCRRYDPVLHLPGSALSKYSRITMTVGNETDANYRGCEVLAGTRPIEDPLQRQHHLRLWADYEFDRAILDAS